MSINFQLVSDQSTTHKPKTQPHPTISSTAAQQVKQEHHQRLDLYTSLFGHGANKICEKTGLQLIPSLNYSLHTFLHLNDSYWVLAMIAIDGLDEMNEKYGKQDAKTRKLHQIGKVVKDFCANDPRKLKGFKCNDLIDNKTGGGDDGEPQKDLFAILMYCHPKLNRSEKYVSKLLKKIKLLTDETVSVGIAKMNQWETFEEWKQRGLKNVKNATNIAATIETNDTTGDGTFYSDINVKYVNPILIQVDDQDEKTQEDKEQVVNRMGNKEDFEKKMKEIANKEDYEWIGVIMEIDHFDSFVFNNNNNKQIISKEINKVEQEMFYLFDIYGNSVNDKNEINIKYFGYKLNGKGSKYGLILFDSKDTSKCFIPAHEILETLKEEINVKCQFTVSIGSSRLIEDDFGMTDDWIERIQNNVTRAQSTGGNQAAFGNNSENANKNDGDAESKVGMDGDNQSSKKFTPT